MILKFSICVAMNCHSGMYSGYRGLHQSLHRVHCSGMKVLQFFLDFKDFEIMKGNKLIPVFILEFPFYQSCHLIFSHHLIFKIIFFPLNQVFNSVNSLLPPCDELIQSLMSLPYMRTEPCLSVWAIYSKLAHQGKLGILFSLTLCMQRFKENWLFQKRD